MTQAEMIAKFLAKFNLTEDEATLLVETVKDGGGIDDLDESFYDNLFSFYCNNGEMPYGIAKARTGDPYVWIDNALRDELGLGV
ncbi:hypothetical protein [Acinetobacter sp.]|uniref:hypothetical protein n=1 Tax=Acinetobacter sp. TaxID=472 RepID=UPI00388EE77F